MCHVPAEFSLIQAFTVSFDHPHNLKKPPCPEFTLSGSEGFLCVSKVFVAPR